MNNSSGKIYDYNKLTNSVKELDWKIRFAGIINERGRLVAGGIRDEGEPLISKKDDEMIFMELALRVRMRKDFEEKLGKVKFSMTLRDNYLGMTFPIRNDFLYIITTPLVNHVDLSTKIIELIKNQ